MEVTDPYTNTTTVKNILQHIIVPKIVSDESSGYVTKTDLINVHNIVFSGNSTTVGANALPNTSQSGSFVVTAGQSIVVYHSRVTTNSVIIACTQSDKPSQVVRCVIPNTSFFTVLLANTAPTDGVRVGWFIAHF
jgi:hypothetical protein